MRRRFWRPGDRAIGIVLGIVLGIAVIILFLFLSSRNTIDEPSLSGGADDADAAPAGAPAHQGDRAQGKALPVGLLTDEIGNADGSQGSGSRRSWRWVPSPSTSCAT